VDRLALLVRTAHPSALLRRVQWGISAAALMIKAGATGAFMGFVVLCFPTFFALRRIHSTRIRYWTNVIDTIFLASLPLLLMAEFVTLYGSFR
jgi:nitrate reductase gamma subunit